TALDENTPLIVAAGEGIQHARFDTEDAKLYWLDPTPFDTQTEDAVPQQSVALASLSGDEAVAPGFALLDQRYLTLFRYVRAPDALPHAYRLTARLELAALLEAHALLALNPTTLAFAASNSVRQSIFFVHSEEPSVLSVKQSEVFGENVDPHRPLSELAVSPRGDELCALRGSELICFTLGFD
ncbi:MAG: hypothetical protein RBU37_14185, partial [Myxococcota bacterium]|nr:hypothetical protein [Myxococcota bacterium]